MALPKGMFVGLPRSATCAKDTALSYTPIQGDGIQTRDTRILSPMLYRFTLRLLIRCWKHRAWVYVIDLKAI